MSRVLVIDDDPAIGRSLQLQLRGHGCEVECETSATDGFRRAESFEPELVFLDLQLPDRNGLDLLPDLIALPCAPSVVVITGRQDMEATITAIRRGATDYIRKPLDLNDILLAVEKTTQRLSARRDSVHQVKVRKGGPREIVGKSRAIIDVLKRVAQFSSVKVNVLIEAESGTGKELVARAIHQASARVQPFVAINCVALASGVWESEMFGHEKGAFTGATRRHVGRLEAAEEGTLFLDEIGDLPLDLQGKLLRVIQEREFERVGGRETIPFRARIVAATHRDLRHLAADGRFREDLLHRLEVARLRIPPLRERLEDIPLLVDALLTRISLALGREVQAISGDALDALGQYQWPGNVRELENVLMRSVAANPGEVLSTVEIPQEFRSPAAEPSHPPRGWRLADAERGHIHAALDQFQWNISRCARELQVSPTTLRKKIKDYGLRPRSESAD